MSRRLSRAQRQAAFVEAATQMFNQLEEWYEQHPQASFAELEAQARPARRNLMGEVLTLLINGRSEGYQFEPPRCAGCGQALRFEGYRRRTLSGLEGESELSRAYYACVHCEAQTLFPPRPAAAPARRPLE